MTSGSQYDQQPGTPYGADVLNPHDPGLLAAVEFSRGAVGTFFDYGAQGQTNYATRVNERRGMLEIELGAGPGDPDDQPPRGQSFFALPFDKWTELPASNYDRGCIVYARQSIQTTTLGQSGPATPNTAAGVILGTAAQQVQGTVAAADQDTAEVRIVAPEWAGGNPADVPALQWQGNFWTDGAFDAATTGPAGDGDRWWRFVILHTAGAPGECDVVASTSRDGSTWQNCAEELEIQDSTTPPEGLYVGAFAAGEFLIAGLDWVRVYGVLDAETVNYNTATSIRYPDTGGRLYIP